MGETIEIRPRIEEMADRIASWGCVVLAPYCMGRRLATRTARLRPGAATRWPTNAPYDEAATERHFAALRDLFERTL